MIAIYVVVSQAPKTIDVTFNPPGVTMIYSSDGSPLAEYFVENRQQVSIDQIPKDLQNATIAFEDRRFRQHKGIDFLGIGRAVLANLRHGDLHGEGGSTITQQLARNLGVQGLTREKSIQRKLKEWLVANQIEHSYTKDQILEMYLNEVNYGSGAYGVEAAAKTYFGKHVKDLNLAECALLAGLPNRPTYFNPYRDKDLAKRQRNIVLDWMLEEHYITPQQCADAKAAPVKLASPHAPKQGSRIYHAPYFVSYVYQQLKDRYGEQYLKDGNIKVYTTLNWQMQQIAEDAVKQGLDDPLVKGPHGPTQACLVAMDPKTGEIKAMVGGRDYSKSQYNMATQARRQPGSLFKSILYSAAIDSGLVTEDTTVEDSPITFKMAGGESWTPKDDTRYSYRRVTLREALAQSINVPAVRVMAQIKPPTVVQYAKLMGITSPLDPVISLALGSSAVTPLEMVNVYATFPNGGNHVDPVAFTSVEDDAGNVLDSIGPSKPSKVLSAETVQQLDDMLRAVTTEGTGIKVSEDPAVPDARGKTGTTQDHKDAWFVGYTPRLVCGVWAGHPTVNPKTGTPLYGEPMAGNAWGATLCVPIWKNFMLKAEPIFVKAEAKEAARWKNHKGDSSAKTDNSPADNSSASDHAESASSDRPRRRRTHDDLVVHNSDGTVTVNIDTDTGLLAPPGSPNSQPVTFANGQEPKEMAPQYAGQASDAAHKSSGTSADNNSKSGGAATTDNNANTTTSPSDSSSDDSGNAVDSSTNDSTDANSTSVSSSPISSDDNGSSPQPAAPAPPPPPHPRHRQHARAPRPKEYVTVYINPDDGLLATKWTPEKVPKTFLKGTEPHRYTTMYPPPPGEQ
jgi:penicillin-binding protein 1A